MEFSYPILFVYNGFPSDSVILSVGNEFED